MLRPLIKHWQLDEKEFARVLRIDNLADKLSGKTFLDPFQYRRISKVTATAEELEKEGPAFKLLELIEESDVSRSDIASHTGINSDTIRNWLNGNSTPSRSSTFKLAAFIDSLESDGSDEFKYELSKFVNRPIKASVLSGLGVARTTLVRWTLPEYVPTEGNLKHFLPWLEKYNKAADELNLVTENLPKSIGKSKLGRPRGDVD